MREIWTLLLCDGGHGHNLLMRLLMCFSKGNLHLTEIAHVVLDEVDQMLDMGFAPSVEEILQYAYTEGNLKC